jgi:hypothetical protein
MDAEKFDKVVLDLLYDELDELTRASAVRHMEQSGKAKALYAELRATREVGALPLVEPPDDLEAKILAAEQRARQDRPLHQRVGGVVSRIASYTMRPQVGMAAVLMLMLGSGLLFLRVHPGEPGSVLVTERGVPESDKEGVTLAPVPEAPAPVARADESAPARRRERAAGATDLYRGEPEEAKRSAPAKAATEAPRDDLVAAAPPPAPAFPGSDETFGGDKEGAASGEAVAEKSKKGEAEGQPRSGPCQDLESELARAASPIEANRARWALAECFSSVGQNEQARSSYKALLGAPAYAERARRALATLAESAPAASARPATGKPQATPHATTKPAASEPK